ncbi:MAG: hypothetical protein ROZ37_17760 [Aromatoleum sp.]|uniref:hypothetical protein n=1 Tax=Aromatoleum sp. TaxID=2307007 RepID=UPI002894F168|nr:hypothetical protein [Aromatoleum sp.]MDT3672171.1 hypothetical protein [Aromatoleum sp.]
MKRRARIDRVRRRNELRENFVRGFVATGLLAALQDGAAGTSRPGVARAALRSALQGGVALAAGSSAADALQKGNYNGALLAVAGGAAGVIAIDYLTRKPARTTKGGKNNGKEKTQKGVAQE